MASWIETIAAIETIAPENLAEDWDNSGIQLNLGANEIQRILVCLDVTEASVDAAINQDVQLIVSHHPVIFDGLKQVDIHRGPDKTILALAKAGISLYTAHMTYDKTPWGNSAGIACRLGIAAHPMLPPIPGAPEDYSVLLGELSPSRTGHDLATAVSEMLEIPLSELRYAGDPEKPVKRLAVCAGSGGEFLMEASEMGCQAFITGDLKYHTALTASEAGIFILDAGHFGTEKHFVPDFAGKLRDTLQGKAEVLEFMENGGPIKQFT